MASSALVDQLLQSLSFEVEAVPQDNAFNVKNSPNLTPLNVKVRVRKKDVGNAVVRKGTLSVPKPDKPDGPPERVRLASSDQTVMSFNMLMEAEFERKPLRKPKRNFFGLCLGVQGDDDDKYLPSTSVKGKEIDSKSDNGIISTKPLPKNPYDGSSSHSSYIKRDKYFGKCKPGGCLDPPFGEDKYVYQPKHAEGPAPRLALTDELKEKKIKSDFLDASPSKSREKDDREGDNILSLYKQKTEVTENDSDSIITYPSEPRLEEDKPTKQRKASVSKQTRDSFNEQNSPYFNPPKNRKESSNSEKRQIIKPGLPASDGKFKPKDSSKNNENYYGEAGDEITKGREDEGHQLISADGTTVAGTAIANAIDHKKEKINVKPQTTSEVDSSNVNFPIQEKENINSQLISVEQTTKPVCETSQKDYSGKSIQPTSVTQDRNLETLVDDKTGKKDDSNKASQKVTPISSLGHLDEEIVKEKRHFEIEEKNRPKQEQNKLTSDASELNTIIPHSKVLDKVVPGGAMEKKDISNKSSIKHSPRSTSKDGISDKLDHKEKNDFSDTTSASTAVLADANDDKNTKIPKLKKESSENLSQIDKKVTDKQNLKNDFEKNSAAIDKNQKHDFSEEGSQKAKTLDKVVPEDNLAKKDGSVLATQITAPRSSSDKISEKNNMPKVVTSESTASPAADSYNKEKKPLKSSKDKIDKDGSLSGRESARDHHKIQQRRDSTGKHTTPRSLSRDLSSENQIRKDKKDKLSQKSTPRSLSLDRSSVYSEGKTGRKNSTEKALKKPSPRSLSLDRGSENKELQGRMEKRNSVGKSREITPRSLSREKSLDNKNSEEEGEQKNLTSNKPSRKPSPRSISRDIPDDFSFVTDVSLKSDQHRKRSDSILSENIEDFSQNITENETVFEGKIPSAIASGNESSAAIVSQDRESVSSKRGGGSTGKSGVLKKDSSHRYSSNKSSRETSIKFLPLETPEIEKSNSSEIDSHKKGSDFDESYEYEPDKKDVKNIDKDRDFDQEHGSTKPVADYQTDEDLRTDVESHKDTHNQMYKDSTSIFSTDTKFREDLISDKNNHFISSDVDGDDSRVNTSRSPDTHISASISGKDVKSSQLAIDVYFDIEATDVSTERISGNINETDSIKPKSQLTDMGDSSYMMDVDNFEETQETGKRSKSLSIELEVVVEGLKRNDDEKFIAEENNAQAFNNLKDISLHENEKVLGEIKDKKDKKIKSKEILSNEDQKSLGDALSNLGQKKESSETRLVKSKSEDSIFLNLAFQTYLEDNQTVVRTLDSLKDNDANNVVMVKSLWKSPDMNEITVPIDSGRVMQIQIKKTKVDQVDRISKSSKPLITKFDKVSGKLTSSSSTLSLGKRLSVTLSAVYSQDLVPLEQIIKGLKQDIDELATQQIKLRERIGWGPGKSKQLNITTCGCLKNTYENLSTF